MLADRIRMSYMSGSKMYDDPLQSVGSWDLIMGDRDKGYFGTVNGLVNNTQLITLMDMTFGTLLDSANADITFHKFIHKGRILLIPSRPIKHSISWDNIQAKDGVKGKVIIIGGQEYLCRLMTGSRHYYTSNPSIAGGEWGGLFIGLQISVSESIVSWCQEVHSNSISQRVYGIVYNVGGGNSNMLTNAYGWLPILEVL